MSKDDMLASAVRAKALRDAADALEGRLGVEGTPRDLWEFRQWLRDRAKTLETPNSNQEAEIQHDGY